MGEPVSTVEYDCPLCGAPVLRMLFANGRRAVEPIYLPDPPQPGDPPPCAHPYGRELAAAA